VLFLFSRCVVTGNWLRMESLPPKTQDRIKKLSTEYLVLKLTKAGLDEEAILKMSRDHLMAACAELVRLYIGWALRSESSSRWP